MWSEEAMQCVRQFGKESARLYPNIDSNIETDGKQPDRKVKVRVRPGVLEEGRLLQVLEGEARVILDSELERAKKARERELRENKRFIAQKKPLPKRSKKPGVGRNPAWQAFDYRRVIPA